MTKNNIPSILKDKKWTRYKLWQELGGSHSDRNLVYNILMKDLIPDGVQWGTMKRVAKALNVPLDVLEIDEEALSS